MLYYMYLLEISQIANQDLDNYLKNAYALSIIEQPCKLDNMQIN